MCCIEDEFRFSRMIWKNKNKINYFPVNENNKIVLFLFLVSSEFSWFYRKIIVLKKVNERMHAENTAQRNVNRESANRVA